MSWLRFDTANGGMLMVNLRHVVAVCDENGEVKLATTAGGVHTLKDMTVQRAAAIVARAADIAPLQANPNL